MKYSLVLHTPEHNISFDMYSSKQKTVNLSPFFAHISYKKESIYEIYDITISSETKQKIYVSLTGEGDADFYSFHGLCKKERIFRQSPHDPLQCHFKMEKSAVPMVAAVKDGKADIFISDNPSYFDNATTQHIIPEEHRFYLSSGDKGGMPNCPESKVFDPIYHEIGGEKTHTFRFIAFQAADAKIASLG